MRSLRVPLAVLTIVALLGSAGLAGDRDAQKAAFREVIALEKEAAELIPEDFDAATAKLEEAQAKLEAMNMGGDVEELAASAGDLDGFAVNQIENMTSDGEVTQEEMEQLDWLLLDASAHKTEALGLIRFLEAIDRMSNRKRTPLSPVTAPLCQQGQGVSAQSSCYTVDTWSINIDKGAQAAVCKFVDGDGNRVTNLRPLFNDVIQQTTCRLTDKTVTVNGVRKRVVRATLKLTTLSKFDPRGSADVRVTASWR